MGIYQSFLTSLITAYRRVPFFILLTAILLPVELSAQVSFLDTQFQIGGDVLASPGGVVADNAGNLYVTDGGNNRVVQFPVSSTGFGAPVTIASSLSHPTGITIDWDGNLYIADSGNSRVVKLPAVSGRFGSLITIAAGLDAPGGIAIDTVGNLFIADTGNNRIVELPALGSSFGAPVTITSGFNAPGGVAVDPARNLMVADTGNNRIVKLTYASGYTAAQSMFTTVVSPAGIAVDASYNLFIASSTGHKVVEEPWFAGANRYSNVVNVGTGYTNAVGVFPDARGNVFIVDSATSQLWEIPAASQPFPAVSVGTQGFSQNYNFTVAAGTVIGVIGVLTQGVPGLDFLEGNSTTCAVQTYASATVCSVQVKFSPTGTGLRNGAIVFYDASGNVLISDYFYGTGIGARSSFFPATQTSLGAGLSGPSGVAVDGAGNIYIADTGNNRIVEIPCSNGSYGSEIALPVGQLSAPMGMAFDAAGNLFITSSGNDKLVEVLQTGNGLGAAVKVPVAVYVPTAVSVDGNGTLYIADSYDNRIVQLPRAGNGYGKPHSPGSETKMPMGIAVDNAGDILFSRAYRNDLIWLPLQAGVFQNQVTITTSHLSFPTALVTDGNSNLYLLDSGNNRVVMYPWTSSGYGAQMTIATGFNNPAGMTIDGKNNLYIADSGNNRIVKITLSQPSLISFQSTYVSTISADSAQYLVAQNTGNLPLGIPSLSYAFDFPEDPASTSACTPGSTLAPGAGCTLAIDFSPQSVGPLKETVSLVVASGEEEQAASVPVSGSGLARQPQTVTFPPIGNVVYGSSPVKLQASSTSGLPVTFKLVSGPAALASNGYQLSFTGAGTVVIAASQAGNATWQPAPPVTITIPVAPATLTITPKNVSATYGSIPSSFAYSVTGLLPGQSLAQNVTGQPSLSLTGSAPFSVGTHAIVAAKGTLQSANYIFTFATGTLTVNPAVVQIVAAPASMIYGSTLPKFTWTAKGFVNADAVNVLKGAPVFATLASSRSAVGVYTITPSAGTLTAENYIFTYVASTLTITPATLTVTAVNQAMVYGSAIPNMAYTVTGFMGADTTANALTGTPAYTTTAGPHSNVGQYPILASTGTLKAANYTLTFTNGTMTVVPAPLTVMPATVTVTYGQSIPALKNLQLIGLVNGDTAATALKGTPILATTATASTPPGTVAITIQRSSLTSTNYTVDLQPGLLIINKAALTVTPASVTRIYGAPNPTIGYAITGFVNGDTAAQLSGAPVIVAAAAPSSAAGVYAVTATPGTLSSANYSFTFGSGTITVTKVPLTVTANSLSITYGSPVPTLTYAITGFVNGDASSVVTGKATLTTTAAATPAAGSYPISLDASKLSAANYTFTAVAGTLTVTKANATVTANNQSVTLGSGLPSFTYTVTGLVNGDQAATAITGTPTLATAATKSSAVGSYAIIIAAGTMTAKNYTLKLVNGTLTITQPAGTVVNPQPITPRLPSKKLP
jgi:sugar lactone lactonase YvrE